MKKAMLLVFFCLFFSSCVSTQPTGQDKTLTLRIAERSFIAYKDCMLLAAESYYMSEALAFEIGEAAQGKCGRDFFIYEQAIKNHFMSVVTMSGKDMALRKAEEHLQKTKQLLNQAVVQRVIELRLSEKKE